jgi:hypothetical protein
LARENASPVPATVGDPAAYCDDPGDQDTLAEPDIGFLESCFEHLLDQHTGTTSSSVGNLSAQHSSLI